MVSAIVRCPYCVEIDLNAFRVMFGTLDGTYACLKCGHVAMSGNEAFRCLCSHCVANAAFAPKEPPKILRLRPSA
jgi:DNA-directed RNA polymerase subunit RPC12/RpoP